MKKLKIPEVHDMHPNVTPLIDVVMCLIVFYMLVAKIGVATGAVPMDLPISVWGKRLQDMGNTITLNVIRPAVGDVPIVTTLDPETGQIVEKPILDTSRVPPRRVLTETLTFFRKVNPEIKAIIRADQNIEYRFLEPVLICCAEAQVKNVNFATRVAQQVAGGE